MRLLPNKIKVTKGSATFDGRDLQTMSNGELRKVRGGDVGFDECVGGDPVQVQHVEDHDVARAHPPQQSIDIAIDPGGADNTRPDGVATGQKRSHPRRHTHGGDSVGEEEPDRGGAP